jgi:nitroreductase
MSEIIEGTSMTVEEAILQRRSVRGFLEKPVPREILERVFALAQRAPSNCNIQPWHVFVASGAARDRIREAMIQHVKGGKRPNPDYDYPAKFEGEYRRRQVDCAVALYSEMGIARDDSEGRLRASLRNFELFDAPHVAFIGMQLAMTAHGIASCPQGSMRSYPDIVRKEFGASDDILILVGLSFGYEDESIPANRTRTTRAPIAENVHFKD